MDRALLACAPACRYPSTMVRWPGWMSTPLLAAVACMSVDPANESPSGTGGVGGALDGGADSGPPPDGALCWPTQKWCGGCVEATDPKYGCAQSACDACAVPQASAKCEADQCGVQACDAGYADCNQQPADGCEINTKADHGNCGGCGKACTASEGCFQGKCSSTCGALANCNGSCVNSATDPQHCGGCGNACASAQTCQSGACVCPSGLAFCAGACTDTKASKQHCGGCGKACTDPANGVASCSNGSCVLACFGGTTLCGSQCVITASNSSHCGGCNKACATGEPCQAGSCVATYVASVGFSSEQGKNGWSYWDSSGSPMTFVAAQNWWQGPDPFVNLTAIGGHPGSTLDAVRRWTAPKAGSVKITGKASDAHGKCGADGVNVSIRKGSTLLWQSAVALDDNIGVAFNLASSVAAGEKIDFVLNKGVDNYCDSTAFDPTIVLSYAP